ncbi:MAG: formimidoylglutamate deiminase, partial [Myxococcales bacterium]|nr:formimidoylglutamate deiminase [Myxococcales bacterium]
MVRVSPDGEFLCLPGIATAHSHAFQRALRGRTERPDSASGSFWSWRALMYDVASRLDPDTMFAVARYAFFELARSGVTAVGEFHYVHHGPAGVPYAERTALADAVIEAALDVGIRITLLRVVYERGGHGQALDPVQRRFVDAAHEHALEDVDQLRAKYRDAPLVRVGVAPHSVRAVTLPSLRSAAAHARREGLPLHMHVAEQRRELDECVAEHGLTPVALLAAEGILDDRFVGVHATHLTQAEAEAFGRAGAYACICRTTERDLGDGAPDIRALRDAGARFCVGVDSHASSDPFEELRAVELDERTRTESRLAGLDAGALLSAAAADGYASIGWAGAADEDEVRLRADDPALVGASPSMLHEAVIFGATPRAVAEVRVGG